LCNCIGMAYEWALNYPILGNNERPKGYLCVTSRLQCNDTFHTRERRVAFENSYDGSRRVRLQLQSELAGFVALTGGGDEEASADVTMKYVQHRWFAVEIILVSVRWHCKARHHVP